MSSVRVFLSSPYRDMQAERAYLHEVVFPRVAEKYQASGYSLEIVDPRLTAANEDEAEGVETLEAALDEVAACRPYFLCLLGNNYGKVTLEVPDPIGRKHPAVRHFFRTSRVHLETLAAVIREPANAGHSFFYFRKPQIVTKLFDADKQAYVPNNKMEALNEVEAHKLNIFKEAITRTARPIFHYSCQWDSMNRQLTGFEQLGARIENDLLSMVGLASAAVVEETIPGSMATEEMATGGGSMLAAAAVGGAVAGAAVVGGAARPRQRASSARAALAAALPTMPVTKRWATTKSPPSRRCRTKWRCRTRPPPLPTMPRSIRSLPTPPRCPTTAAPGRAGWRRPLRR